jgi:hypothetical protein
MNRREFVGHAALAPLAASAANLEDARFGKPSILLPDSAHVYDIGRGEARILVGAEQSGGAWWLGSFRNDPGSRTSMHLFRWHACAKVFLDQQFEVGTNFLVEI